MTINGLTLETPPAQALGGGYNSSLSATTVTLETPIASGASINVNFLFNVSQAAFARACLHVESLPTGATGDTGVAGEITASGTNTATCSLPGEIVNLSATGQLNSITLDWDDAAAGTATAYQVFRRNPDGTYPVSPTATVTTLATLPSTYTDPGRTPETVYCYKVRGVNSNGVGALSNEVCASRASFRGRSRISPPPGCQGRSPSIGAPRKGPSTTTSSGAIRTGRIRVCRRRP